MPIGSSEQHGPTGLCGTDAICAETIAAAAGSEAGVLVLPTLAYTPAQFNMGFPGTISIRARTLIALLLDIFAAASTQGIERLLLLSGHGGNHASIDAAVHDYYVQAPATSLRVERLAWWELGEVPALRREFFGDGEGLHATPSEISITQAVARCPDWHGSIVHRPLDAATIARLGGDRHGPAKAHVEAYPDGLVGSDPSLASPELGRRLLDAAVAGLVGELRA